jgi:hypothetical protein
VASGIGNTHVANWDAGALAYAKEAAIAQGWRAVTEIVARRAEMVKRKKDRRKKGTEARRRARKSALAPAGTRVIPDKRRKPQKHKPDLLQQVD